MNMIFKTISGVLLILFFANGVLFAGNELTVPVDGEQLYNVLVTAQKKNTDAENMICNALSKIHIKDAIRIVAVNFKGTGAVVQPDVEVKGDKISLTLGAVLEFDIEKYKQNVMAPLREVLKQVSTNGGKEIIPNISHEVEVEKERMKYGNISYQKLSCFHYQRMDVRFYTIVLNVLPNPSCIFKSTYEAYKLNVTSKIYYAILHKIAEGNRFVVHFVFKDEAGQEVFHEQCWGMKTHSGMDNIASNLGGPQFGCEYALFLPWGDFRGLLPLLISPETMFENTNIKDGYDKAWVKCQIEADASTIKRIKSYEIFIEEAKIDTKIKRKRGR